MFLLQNGLSHIYVDLIGYKSSEATSSIFGIFFDLGDVACHALTIIVLISEKFQQKCFSCCFPEDKCYVATSSLSVFHCS